MKAAKRRQRERERPSRRICPGPLQRHFGRMRHVLMAIFWLRNVSHIVAEEQRHKRRRGEAEVRQLGLYKVLAYGKCVQGSSHLRFAAAAASVPSIRYYTIPMEGSKCRLYRLQKNNTPTNHLLGPDVNLPRHTGNHGLLSNLRSCPASGELRAGSVEFVGTGASSRRRHRSRWPSQASSPADPPTQRLRAHWNGRGLRDSRWLMVMMARHDERGQSRSLCPGRQSAEAIAISSFAWWLSNCPILPCLHLSTYLHIPYLRLSTLSR